jgi:hypothetical protein
MNLQTSKKKAALGLLMVISAAIGLLGFQNCSSTAASGGGNADIQQVAPVQGGSVGYQISGIKTGMPTKVSVQVKNDVGTLRVDANGAFSLTDTQNLLCPNSIAVSNGVGSGYVFAKEGPLSTTIHMNFQSQDSTDQTLLLDINPPVVRFYARDFTPEHVFPSGTIPDARSFHSAIYDPTAKRMLIFGGRQASLSGSVEANTKVMNDVWSYSTESNSWSQVVTTNSPPARYLHAAAYDSKRNRMLIFGGKDGTGTRLSDLWALNFSDMSWSQVTTTGTPPSGRSGSALYFDALADRAMALTGGATGDNVWSLYFDSANQGHWVKNPTTGTEPNTSIQTTYDIRSSLAINSASLIATLSPKTLDLSSYAWTASASPYLGDNINGSLVFDPINGQTVSLGGGCCLAFDAAGSAGNYSTSALVLGHDGLVSFPFSVHGHTAVYDPINFKMIVFGGESVTKTGTSPVTYAVAFLNQTYTIPLPRRGCP